MATRQKAVAAPVERDMLVASRVVDPVLASSENPTCSQWYAVVVKPRHEKTASRALEHKGYQTFLPLFTRGHRYGTRSRDFQLPLFPGYVFCRLDLRERWGVVVTPAVIRILGLGLTPTPLADEEITALQVAVRNQLSMQAHPFLQEGDKARISEGPLAGIEGVVIRAKDPLRVVLSVTLLQRSVLVEVDSARLARHSPSPVPCGVRLTN
jgi:transcription antitermination factor NusG